MIQVYLPTSVSSNTYSVNDDVLVDQISGVFVCNRHVDEEPFVLSPHHLAGPLCGF